MEITRETLVLDAANSSSKAPALFEEHGIDVLAKCKGMSDMVTMEEAEDWCGIKDMDGLIEKLRQAAGQS